MTPNSLGIELLNMSGLPNSAGPRRDNEASRGASIRMRMPEVRTQGGRSPTGVTSPLAARSRKGPCRPVIPVGGYGGGSRRHHFVPGRHVTDHQMRLFMEFRLRSMADAVDNAPRPSQLTGVALAPGSDRAAQSRLYAPCVTSLFAALDIPTGCIIGNTIARRRFAASLTRLKGRSPKPRHTSRYGQLRLTILERPQLTATVRAGMGT